MLAFIGEYKLEACITSLFSSYRVSARRWIMATPLINGCTKSNHNCHSKSALADEESGYPENIELKDFSPPVGRSK